MLTALVRGYFVCREGGFARFRFNVYHGKNMSMDIRFIAFSEKVAEERWKVAKIFDFLSVFDELESGDDGTTSVQDELIRLDFVMGGVVADLTEGKHFNWLIDKLIDACISDAALKKRLTKDVDIEPHMPPKESYLALFDLISEKEIRKHFSNDNDVLLSLLNFYQELEPMIKVLHDPDRVLYVNVNDELLSSAYFINRAKEHMRIVQIFYTKYKESKSKTINEGSNDGGAVSENQMPLL